MPTNGVLGESRLFRWNDITADHTIGTAPNRTMIATPGVTNAQPVSWSEATALRTGCGRPRPGPGCRPIRRRPAMVPRTVMSAGRQDLIDLLRRGCQRGLWLAAAEQDRHDHGAQDLGNLRVLGDLRT